MKRPARNGSTHLVLSPLKFLERLVALIPPPRVNSVRYHGVLAPAARRRKEIVPAPPPPAAPAPAPPPPATPVSCASRRHPRVPWAELLRRVYKVDALSCPDCGSRMRVLAYLADPPVVRQILDHLGLPSSPPPRAPARDPLDRPAFW